MNCFKMRGKKGDEHFDPLDPPRRRANQRRGCGTYENDRPPVLGVIGRQSGEVRWRVVVDTKAMTLEEHVHTCTLPDCHVYTDEYDSYNGIARSHLALESGHAMMMAMGFEKSTPIPLKACGPAYATSCVPFAVCTRNTSQAMSLCMNAELT